MIAQMMLSFIVKMLLITKIHCISYFFQN